MKTIGEIFLEGRFRELKNNETIAKNIFENKRNSYDLDYSNIESKTKEN